MEKGTGREKGTGMEKAAGMETITVVGYGSLLSERSAKETVPGLKNFQLVTVPGYRRIFNKVGVSFIHRYGLAQSDSHIASCSTQVDTHTEIIGCAFDVIADEFKGLYEREHRFQWVNVQCFTTDGRGIAGRMCTQSSDEFYRLNKCVTDDVYHHYVGQYYSGKIWRNDILPFPVYLNHCLQAAREHGQRVYENFIHTTYLADAKTTIAELLIQQPEYLNTNLAYTYQKAKSD